MNTGKKKDRSPALGPRPDKLRYCPPPYWPIQAHGSLLAIVNVERKSVTLAQEAGASSIRATSVRATTKKNKAKPESTFTVIAFIALPDPSVSPSSGIPSSSCDSRLHYWLPTPPRCPTSAGHGCKLLWSAFTNCCTVVALYVSAHPLNAPFFASSKRLVTNVTILMHANARA